MTSINLLNLAKIGQLDPVPLSMALVKRMLLTAQQRMRDAELTQNSPETRFDCAYTAIRALADIGLHLQGFRTSTSKPGHHQTVIQSLAHTLDVDAATVRVLDGLRKQRNLTDYSGEPVSKAAVDSCLSNAKALQAHVHAWLQGHRADWLS